ncbi:MAG TPA: 50S ribosomal protein P1 [Methanothermococcus okinawensis]|uniref:Large ribosomal subunit protein P1 n=1 Tax=Methanothermococcus okinawensis TaxID=155863 RepID=A0A832ZDU9_9EURY|nr:50S ribosomal protein P1 [Methanothermococcus okinawensis]HIP90965.1 50S ribosomal protein P1 [Methanothermococcus okinawensis]
MEYIYAALILHSVGKEITEDGIKSILSAAGVEVDEARVKALVTALEGIDIDEVLEKATIAPVAAPAPAPEAEEEKKEKKEEKKEEEKKEDATVAAAAGLGALFM